LAGGLFVDYWISLQTARLGRSRVIPQLQEHLFHFGKSDLAPMMLLEGMQLPERNLVLLEGIWRGEESAHVLEERLGYAGWQLDRLTGHGRNIGAFGSKVTVLRQVSLRSAEK
jgi:hypothetical protein